jgi:hypothetical protein
VGQWWERKRRRESGREKIFGEPVKEGRRFGEEEGRERKKSSVLCFSLRLCIFFSFADVAAFDWVL